MSRTFPGIYAEHDFVLSYELFPPKTEKGVDDLRENIQRLLRFTPHYITCTYGAGGGTRGKTLETLAVVRELTSVPLASHLTCIGTTAGFIGEYLRQAMAQGVENVVAIRGDQPQNAGDLSADTSESSPFSYANELVAHIAETFPDMGIAVGGYPEVHPEAGDAKIDMDNLKRKVDAGAHVVITQLFYDNEDFYRFRDRYGEAGISVPLVPGILPVTSYAQVKRITALCGAQLPSSFEQKLQDFDGDPESQLQLGVEQATAQAKDLMQQGVPGMHFYVLNKSRSTNAVLEALHPPLD